MADPIMDLFEDTPLFNLDALPEDSFSQGSSDPVEEALKLALGQVDPPGDTEPGPELSITPGLGMTAVVPAPIPDPVPPPAAPVPVPVQHQTVQVALQPTVSMAATAMTTTTAAHLAPVSAVQVQTHAAMPVVSSAGGGGATVLLSSPLTGLGGANSAMTQQQLTQIAQQLTPQQLATLTQQAGGKIVILKGPQGQAQVLQTVSGAAGGGGKVIRLVSAGTQLRPGMSILQGGAVQAQLKVGVAVGVRRQRWPVVKSTGPSHSFSVPRQVQQQPQSQQVQVQLAQGQTQVQIQPAIQAQVSAASAVSRPTGVTLTTVPQQAATGTTQAQAVSVTAGTAQQQQGQTRLVLGQLPSGKLVLQGGQLALTQARAVGQAGGQPKVLTIQLQVQQQPNAQGGVKYQLVSGGGTPGSPQVVQITQGQGGQRVALPLKMLLQPQASAVSSAGGTVSVVKVINTSAAGSAATTTTTSSSSASGGLGGQAIRITKASGETVTVRRVETLCKQEKANRIVAEAIARAKARGEKNLPRVLNQDELPASHHHAAELGGTVTVVTTTSAKKKSSKKKAPAAGGANKGGGDKKGKPKAGGGTGMASVGPLGGSSKSKSKGKTKRSNRVVKRKKYTEDLDIKITDDEDEQEDVDVTTMTTTAAAVASISGGRGGGGGGGGHGGGGASKKATQLLAQQLKQELELDADGQPSMQFFVENPSEEDAAIVDKILSMRSTRKEVSPGQYIIIEEFFVKYKNYSYMHCEWSTMEQLERDKRIHQKLKRFKTKYAQMRKLFQEEEEAFNPDYVEVDRILDESHSVDKDNGEPLIYYLVKWCSLPYEDATWELKEDVDEGKVEEFKKIQDRPPRLKRTPRPPAASWKKLEEFREYKSGNVLREYQLEGVNWLLFNWYNRQNCILADEMGLGKTIQSISLLSEVFGAGLQGPFLVIAPLSTITNWEREFTTWTNMNAIVYHGSLASRQMIQQYEMYCKDDKEHLIPGAYKFDALITTFEMILSDCPELREISWRCVIIDEAHRLKNRNCKLLDSLKMLDLEHKVLLTGTPLQNTVEELFSLLHFLEPAQFPSETEFLREFGDLKTEEQVQKLQSILKPMMLRRLKEDVEKNLAPKQETIIEVELTDVQKKYYRAILERNFAFLSMGVNSNSNVPNLLNTMMELRKCCNHPYLINGAEEKIVAELRQVYDPMALDFHLQALIRSAGKLVLLDKLLPRLKAGGHKVLIFSQMVRCLDILEDYLINKSKPDSDRFVFLLCTRAGGLGINLTAADTCVIFDSDWNPQNDLQVYRLITRNSYEREMLDKASLKLGLDRAVLQSMSGNKDASPNGVQQFSKKEIEDLLRKGAYAAIMDENDEGNRFCEEDIDQILQRRATTITIESEGKGSTFSKASFVASENRNDIALDDPEFWQNDDEYPPANARQSRSWGRWRDILSHARSKRRLGERDVETICRVILVFCLLHYRGDENIKSFIWALITPTENGREPQTLLNHSGLSIPVPRGRKGKRVKAQSTFDVQKVEWIRKVLLRVRMLYYLKQEVIGEKGDAVLKGADYRNINIWMPDMEQQEVPAGWWDSAADRSLLMGIFKHADPCFCFLERAGRPDDKAIDAEQPHRHAEMGEDGDDDKYSEDARVSRHHGHVDTGKDMHDSMNMDDEVSVDDRAPPPSLPPPPHGLAAANQSGACEWPTSSSLTARLRRLVTAYQRSYRQEQLKMEAEAKGDRRRRRCEQASKLKEIARQERQQRWTRREECDFYRVVSTFGVEKAVKREQPGLLLPAPPEDPQPDYDWSRFRTFARLDKKTDESLSRYFRVFCATCGPHAARSLAPITEERASRTLYRISLLRRLRERVLPHPALEERLLLAPPSQELPAWWSPPEHDRQLMLGASLHGVSRTELSIYADPQFTFSQAHQDFLVLQQNQPQPPPATAAVPPLAQPKLEEGDGPEGMKEEEVELEMSAGVMAMSAPPQLQSTPLSHHHHAKGREWGFKGERSRGRKAERRREGREGREGGEGGGGGGGGSDSDTESESGSSSSERSASSDDSGESDARLKMEDGDGNSLLSLSQSQGEALPPDPLRVDWPKDRVLINRLDSLCTLVLSGQWPTGRRYMSEVQLSAAVGGGGSDELAADELSFARLMRKVNSAPGGAEGDDSGFTVKLLKEEGLKLTFSKQALMPNGSAGESSGRKRHKEQELSDPDGQAHDPMERTPRRRDPATWLKEIPDYEVEGDMLELLVNRSKRKRRRRRADKPLTGSEKVKVIHMRTGKKVAAAFCPMLQDLREYLEENPEHAVVPDWSETVRNSGFLPESLFDRLLTEDSDIPKRIRRRHHHHHHHHRHHRPVELPVAMPDPLLGGVGVRVEEEEEEDEEEEEEEEVEEEETLVSDGAYMMDEEDLDSSHHFLTNFDVKMEVGGAYDSSDQEALLDDVVMAPKDSDSSSSSED
ncbi:hypothetical protein CRUP_007710 [Coryphaenoides rupestris]|nr:hypothetical protein CRUP_007710 [Coryphaenoides rupestris]